MYKHIHTYNCMNLHTNKIMIRKLYEKSSTRTAVYLSELLKIWSPHRPFVPLILQTVIVFSDCCFYNHWRISFWAENIKQN